MENDKELQPESTGINILDDLEEMDKAIIRLKVSKPSITNNELASTLGVHRDTIAKRLKKEKVNHAIAELQKSAIQTLLDSQNEAARKLITIMRTGKEERTVVNACKEILKGVLSENYNVNLNLSGKKRLIEMMTDEDVDKLAEEIANDEHSS